MAYRARTSSARGSRRSARRSYAGRRPTKRRGYSSGRGSRRSAQVVRLVVESAPATALQRPYSGEVQALMPVGLKRSLV